MERVKCMLSEAKIFEEFCIKALVTTTFTINRSPSVSIDMKTSEEK